VLVLFSGVAFLNFYRTNFESVTGPSRVLHWYLLVLAIAVTGSLAAKAISILSDRQDISGRGRAVLYGILLRRNSRAGFSRRNQGADRQ
jgi:hypothetical protein